MAEQKRILIVEDERPIAKAIELKLNKSGFFAKAVFNGREGLEELERETYDLVLLDILMPEVDGFGFLEKLKEKGNQVKVIVTSNLSQTEDVERAKQMGAVDFLVKSNISLSGILEKVKVNLQ
jgi:two-component system, OmpR family, alkaline phosphatase synthesis response regulator PhoP